MPENSQPGPRAVGDAGKLDGHSQASNHGYTMNIHRKGCVVQITLTGANEYQSIQLFDTLVQTAKRGSLHLDLLATSGTTEPA